MAGPFFGNLLTQLLPALSTQIAEDCPGITSKF